MHPSSLARSLLSSSGEHIRSTSRRQCGVPLTLNSFSLFVKSGFFAGLSHAIGFSFEFPSLPRIKSAAPRFMYPQDPKCSLETPTSTHDLSRRPKPADVLPAHQKADRIRTCPSQSIHRACCCCCPETRSAELATLQRSNQCLQQLVASNNKLTPGKELYWQAPRVRNTYPTDEILQNKENL